MQTNDEMVHGVCSRLRFSEECKKCPRMVDTNYGPGVNGCYAQAEEICRRVLEFTQVGPVHISDATVPMLDALTEPCKGCGKRPIDLMDFS